MKNLTDRQREVLDYIAHIPPPSAKQVNVLVFLCVLFRTALPVCRKKDIFL